MTTESSQSDTVRVSDAERERAVTALREHAGEGRLDVAELSERLERAYAARTRADLAVLTADLPALPAKAPQPRARRREIVGHVAPFLAVNLALVLVWAVSGAGYFWPIWPILGWGLGVVSHTSRTLSGGRIGCAWPRRGRRPGHRAAA
jgi:Domain of unknown function (DUF1707)/2TM domain